ncbi:MAG: 4a-hydroxytetrahydrobiopterin dehydratase [Anaerolineae bacterium]|nr:4a-hydroxytetrahydrobiopterin dehydratase [Anaerolineae bacterium]
MPRLEKAEIQDRLAKTPGWSLEGDEIRRSFTLKDFASALVFVGAVGHLAEQANHHPDITINYNKVTLALTTHDSGGLTDNDFTLAARINALMP